MPDKIRLLIVDDSALIREAIKMALSSYQDIEVVGMAKDGQEAIEKAIALKPNVITMDINMPKKNGLEAIMEIMEVQPTPIIVVSAMDVKVVIQALGIGAMDFVCVSQDIEQVINDLVEKIRIASRVRPIKRLHIVPITQKISSAYKRGPIKIIAVGVSTGGPQALQVLLSGIPANFPAGILIVQHICCGFINDLAQWLHLSSHLDIKIAQAGEAIKASTVLLAPDNYNIKINKEGIITLSEPAEKMVYVPSIDVMMSSVAESFGDNSVGLIMTGMGKDGVEGIKAIKNSGGTTIAQDERSSVIFGMNKLAIDSGCVDRVIPLNEISKELVNLVKL